MISVVLLGACENNNDDRVPNEGIISLSIMNSDGKEVSEIAGDGEAVIRLLAKIPKNADDTFRKITFKASKGQFLASTSGVYEKTSNYEGIAEAYLKVPLDHGPLFLSAEIGTDSKKYFDEKQLTLLDVGEIIQLEILDKNSNPVTGTVRADGEIVLTLRATVSHNSDAINAIKFSKSDGSFLGLGGDSNIIQITNKVAVIQFKVSKNVGSVYLKAEASSNSNILSSGSVELTRAYADDIIVEPDVLKIDEENSTVIIKTYLVRDTGYVSTGTSAQFDAYQLDKDNIHVPVGRFTGLPGAITNENGVIDGVSFRGDTGNIDFARPIFIKISSRDDDNIKIENIFTLNN